MKKAAVFILLGQSNAVGHGVPMEKRDRITAPLKNVFGLHRRDNQAFGLKKLAWSGYTSDGMNLGETQDHTWSVANCLAKQWQAEIDGGNPRDLPDLYIVHIAIGAQGVSEEYMWYPDREKKLVPGVLFTADISLFPFAMEIFSLLAPDFAQRELEPEIIGLHWRGGEEDMHLRKEDMARVSGIYARMLNDFSCVLNDPPILLHRIIAADRAADLDPSGNMLARMHDINGIFADMAEKFEHVSVFDPCQAPQYIPGIRGNGVFIEDAIHFTPEVNRWVAAEILRTYR